MAFPLELAWLFICWQITPVLGGSSQPLPFKTRFANGRTIVPFFVFPIR